MKDRRIYLLNDWFDDAAVYEYFDCQYEDLDNIVSICQAYEAPCPYELKLVYDTNTGSFDSSYAYTDIAAERDADVVELYEEWRKEICEQLGSTDR